MAIWWAFWWVIGDFFWGHFAVLHFGIVVRVGYG